MGCLIAFDSVAAALGRSLRELPNMSKVSNQQVARKIENIMFGSLSLSEPRRQGLMIL